ncbi:uncharacterized protein LOC120293980 [Eucalyptus grandis]|uniref:uncharacterized protein LOC120293980 n=1 Tax=Eucalyptus grandis TaxID=71139 RepID=UPI00192EBBDA|nr:uncharacterized protein LOC120293980 [Eucalyptus grandis]
MGLSEALTEGDVNAVEKATDPGDNTKACGSESKSDADVDEDSEGNESASEIEVQAPVGRKASRMENKKKTREQKREARKNKALKAGIVIRWCRYIVPRRGGEEEEVEAEAGWSDSEVEKTLERLGLKDGVEAAVDGAFACAQFTASECSRSVASRSCPVVPASTAVQSEPETLQSRPRYTPSEEWEGMFNVGMSSTLTGSVRECASNMAIAKLKVTRKLTVQLWSR